MCGICGSISNQNIDPNVVRNMNKLLFHRGPNGEGEFFEHGIGLAMRRLSIIDLKGGWQPLFNEDKTLILVINGEIYNYVELTKILVARGHKFKTKSDGETILHLYEDYGVSCLHFMRGMFAFALWDKKKKQLFLARDRMGEKPLYLYKDHNNLLFSSELRSLLSSRKVDFILDPVGIDMFFHYHYIPEPNTPIKGIRKLPAGHYILLDQATMNISENCYWRMEDSKPLEGNPSIMIREKLEDVANLIIRADVPVGVALSGGVDSSAIAALAAKYYKGDMHAFTVGYEVNSETDERGTAKRIADHLKMPFHEIVLSDDEFVSGFPIVCSLTDDPIADISAFGYYSVSKKAKEQNVPVLLQGQGGDELFWGYPWLRSNYSYVKIKNNLLKGKAGLSDYYCLKFKEKYTYRTFKKAIKGIISLGEAFNLFKKHNEEDSSIVPFYDFYNGFNWSETDTRRFYGPLMLDSLKLLNSNDPFKINNGWEYPEVTLTKLICTTYLQENGIAQGDRLSMSNSVELRLPLVDYSLVETVIGLRKNYNDIYLPPKEWFNNAIIDILPAWLFKLRKRGFEPPVKLWLNLILKEYGKSLIEGHLVKNGIITNETAIEMANGKIEPKVVFPVFFSALVFEQWLDSFEFD